MNREVRHCLLPSPSLCTCATPDMVSSRRCEVAERGRAVVARLEAGTTLGLMGRGDTAAGLLATLCGHSVEMWRRGGICAVEVYK